MFAAFSKSQYLIAFEKCTLRKARSFCFVLFLPLLLLFFFLLLLFSSLHLSLNDPSYLCLARCIPNNENLNRPLNRECQVLNQIIVYSFAHELVVLLSQSLLRLVVLKTNKLTRAKHRESFISPLSYHVQRPVICCQLRSRQSGVLTRLV